MGRLVAVATLIAGACTGARYEGTAQGPALTMPAHFAEGDQGDGGAKETAADSGLIGAAEREPGPGSQPDPEALHEQRFFEYEVEYDQGRLRIKSVRAIRFARPVPTPRKMGRFAIELWIGHELIERVRFDFPLVAAEDPRRRKARPLDEPASFALGVTATQRVLVPASGRATRAVLVDRAIRQSVELPWPPDAAASANQEPKRPASGAPAAPQLDGGRAEPSAPSSRAPDASDVRVPSPDASGPTSH